MNPEMPLLILAAIAGAIVGGVVVRLIMLLQQRGLIDSARRKSVEQSRSTLKGKMAEQMAPMLPGFPYLPSDARFLGDPVDYVVFNGYTSVKDDNADGADLELVIIDIKHGRSSLTPCQRAVARAVEDGRVRFEVVRIDETGQVATESVRPRRRARN